MNQQQQHYMYDARHADNRPITVIGPNNRSPPASRAYGQRTLNHQSSRQFDSYDPNVSGYGQQMPAPFASAGTPRNDSNRFDMMPVQPSYVGNHYENSSWNSIGNGMQTHSSMNGMGSQQMMASNMSSRSLRPGRGQAGVRTPLPTQWTDQQQQQQTSAYDHNVPSSVYSSNTSQTYRGTPQSTEPEGDVDGPEDLIPTAIVIKNIPFAIKKEMLTQIMSDHNLPLPYAFNYHFDAGVFRGLAFANFSTPDETQQVIQRMNHMDIQGRKLRVEYKKMLPQHERERIEREKRERRGQLEEQHMAPSRLHNQSSMTSLTTNNVPGPSPSPVSTRGARDEMGTDELNMNDPTVMKYFTQLILFIGDQAREVMIFPESVPPEHRRIIHTLAHKQGLDHRSRGHGEQRQVVVTKQPANTSPPLNPVPIGAVYNNDYNRQRLNRAATTDFSQNRNADFHTLERQSSFLDIPNSPSNGGGYGVRNAKSFADLRSTNGSPSRLSTMDLPPIPSVPRYSDMNSMSSQTPSLTPTSSNNALASGTEDITNSMNSMLIGTTYAHERAGINRSTNGRSSDNHAAVTGAIGSQRQSNGNYDDQPRNPERQPRIPSDVSGWGTSFSTRGRPNGLGSRADAVWDDNRS